MDFLGTVIQIRRTVSEQPIPKLIINEKIVLEWAVPKLFFRFRW